MVAFYLNCDARPFSFLARFWTNTQCPKAQELLSQLIGQKEKKSIIASSWLAKSSLIFSEDLLGKAHWSFYHWVCQKYWKHYLVQNQEREF
jgi:hypothetical protein